MNYSQIKWYNDPRSKAYSHTKLFGAVTQFPPTLGRPLRPVENQKNSARCTAYASALNGGYIYGSRFHPDWQAAKIGQEQGYSIDFSGGDPNKVMKSQIDYGYLPYESAPPALTLESNTIENTGWKSFDPSLDIAAAPYKEMGFVKVDGDDLYIAIKSALMLAYDPTTQKGAVVQAFGRWYGSWTYTQDGIVRNNYMSGDFVGYHCYDFIDWKTINGVEYLIAQNSYGENVGQGGYYYFSRDIINREFSLPSTTLKIIKTITPEQKALIAQETPIGKIWRLVANAWYMISTLGKT